MIFLELDPNVVKPGWTPLIITVLLGIVVVMLFLSMRKQFGKISIPREVDEDAPEPPAPMPRDAPRPQDPPVA